MKLQNCIITFVSTHDAIKVENKLKNNNLKIKTIPVPRKISESCGIAIRFNKNDLDLVKNIINENDLKYAKIYLITDNRYEII